MLKDLDVGLGGADCLKRTAGADARKHMRKHEGKQQRIASLRSPSGCLMLRASTIAIGLKPTGIGSTSPKRGSEHGHLIKPSLAIDRFVCELPVAVKNLCRCTVGRQQLAKTTQTAHTKPHHTERWADDRHLRTWRSFGSTCN